MCELNGQHETCEVVRNRRKRNNQMEMEMGSSKGRMVVEDESRCLLPHLQD